MYARAMNRKNRYSPPPGYAGTAFDGEMTGKVHEPTETTAEPSRRSYRPEFAEATDSAGEPDQSRDTLREAPRGSGEESGALEPRGREKASLTAPLGDLLGELRGKIGSEELILLLVMLLCASDGVGMEVILLALVLLAGRE